MLRKLLLILISILPHSKLRILGYRLLCRYKISFDSSIGFLNYIDCRSVTMTGARIGSLNVISADSFQADRGAQVRKLNRFRHLNRVILGEGAVVVARNAFVGAPGGLSPYDRLRNLYIGRDTVVTRSHSIDVTDTVKIGDDVTLAGSAIQIWSHGFDLNHVRIQAPVTIGNHVYVGSRAIVLQGASICDNVSIGAGTVVSKPITDAGFYVSGGLTRKADTSDYTCHPDTVVHSGHRFLRRTETSSRMNRVLMFTRGEEHVAEEETTRG